MKGLVVKDGAPLTLTSIVALLDKPPESVTLTRKLLVPAFALAGVPEMAPLLATVSQVTPLCFEKVRASPGFGSEACAASEPEYAWPALAVGSDNGLLLNDGAALTLMTIVALLDKPPLSVTLTTKVLVPILGLPGVPDNEPLLATFSHAGPLTLAKFSVSPGFASEAAPANVPE